MRRHSRPALAAALTSAFLAVPALAQEGDPVAGEKAFRKCAACHSIEPGAPSKIGPNLHDVVGRVTGTFEGFKYSEAMAKAGQEGHVWTVEELSIYLENPKAAMPGNKMTFVGVKKPEERADVIAYLVSLNPAGAAAAPAGAAPTN
jgi:cytochrome c